MVIPRIVERVLLAKQRYEKIENLDSTEAML